MRPHRAYVPAIADELWIEGGEARHLLRVLRARPGDRLTLFDGRGREALAEVVGIEGERIRVRVLKARPAEREPDRTITVYLALLKGEKLFEVVRAGTELGARRFVLVVSARSVPKALGREKLARLGRVAVAAAKQSGRTRLPEVAGPIPLAEVPPVPLGLVGDPRARLRVAEVDDPTRPLALAVGPEGGFTEEELAALEARGFRRVTLGRRILRAETAACALLALVTAGPGQ